MRLDFSQLLRSDQAQAGEAVGFSALAQFLQPRQFVSVGSDDDFAAHFVGNSVLAAELDHGRRSGHAKPGLHGSRLVVDAGVNDAAVVAALVAGDAVFFFEEQQAQAGKAARNFERDPEPHHTTADDDDIVARISH